MYVRPYRTVAYLTLLNLNVLILWNFQKVHEIHHKKLYHFRIRLSKTSIQYLKHAKILLLQIGFLANKVVGMHYKTKTYQTYYRRNHNYTKTFQLEYANEWFVRFIRL